MKIAMVATNDPAGVAIAFAHAINRYTPHECRLITTETRYAMEYESDIHLGDIKDDDYGEVEAVLRGADVIHFHNLFHEDMALGPLSVRDLVRGKPIVYHEHGHPNFLANVEGWRAIYLRPGRRVFVSTPDLLRPLPEARWIPNPVPVDEAPFLPREEGFLARGPVRIAQAPTRKWHKNTREFAEVARAVAQRRPGTEVLILEGLSWRRCLQTKRNCHVVFDHMLGHFGISSLESLSQGVPVIAGIDDWNAARIAEFTGVDAHPWVVARDAEELERELLSLVADPARRVAVGAASRRFMVDHWTERKVIERLIEAYGEDAAVDRVSPFPSAIRNPQSAIVGAR